MGQTSDNKIDMEGDDLGNQSIDEPNKMVVKKCIHKMNMKGHDDPWCVLFRKTADCDLCYGVGVGTDHNRIRGLYTGRQAEGRCHRGGTLRDAVTSKADSPIFTKHHETVMSRNKAEKMKRLFTIYGGTDQRMLQLQRIDSMAMDLQMVAAQLNHKETLVKLIGRPGVTLLYDEYIIDEKEWVSPFTEGELVTHNDQLARVIKITGPVVKIKLQRRGATNPLDVMDWDIEKRSFRKWVKKIARKLSRTIPTDKA